MVAKIIPQHKKKALPLKKIEGNHLALVAFIRELYDSVTDRSPENLGLIEHSLKQGVEKIYGNPRGYEEYTVKFLLDEVFKILNHKKEWNVKEKELYELFEKSVFIRAYYDEFKDFFKNLEEVVTSAIYLDFKKRVSFTILKDEDNDNIFNYGGAFLNMIVDKMQKSVVSRKAINSMFNTIPGYVMIVTDKSGEIRFVNKLGEQLLKAEHTDLIGKPIHSLFPHPRYDSIEEKIKENGEISDMMVNLQTKDNRFIAGWLTVKESKEDAEIEEVVYMLKTEPTSREKLDFDITKESHDKIAPLDSIAGISNLLKRQFIDPKSQEMLLMLDKSINWIFHAS